MPGLNGTIFFTNSHLHRKNKYSYLNPAGYVIPHWHKQGLDLTGFTLFLQSMLFPFSKFLPLLCRSVLLAIYGAFFLVQFLCVTGQDNTTVSTAMPSYHYEQGKQKMVAAKSDRNKKTKIRLNKRFQPAIADTIINPVAELPVKYISTSNPPKPKDYLLISFILVASLRGPPSLS